MDKSILKRIMSFSVSAAVLASALVSANAATLETPPVKAVVKSQETGVYKDYLDGKVQMAENSGVRLAQYAVEGTVFEPSEALPSSYKSNTTDIRDQGSYNTCWAFATMGVMETFLLQDKKGQKDLSEEHLSWWSTKQYNSDGYGWQLDGLDAGGYSMIGAGYLTSWQGAKNESDVPYGGGAIPDNMETAENSYNATGIVYVANDINSVKQAVYQYGAVATSFNAGDGFNDDFSAYCQMEDTILFSGHAITIVGWDDNYDRANFSSKSQPPANGAWLVRNSWGKDVGDDGYLWISYYDRYLLDTNTWGVNYAVTGARTSKSYDRLYQNEEYGATYQTALFDEDIKKYYQEATFVNVFDFDSEHDKLEKVIFETQTMYAGYSVYYIPVENDKPVADKSSWELLATGTTKESGYISVDINAYRIPSGKGAIGVTIAANDGDYASLGVDEWLVDAGNNYMFMPETQRRNESFVIADSGVYDLVDIYAANEDDIGGTLVIKALTTSNIIGDVNFDGRLTLSDAIDAQRYAVGYGDKTEDIIMAADVNLDGRITFFDSLFIQFKIMDLISDF